MDGETRSIPLVGRTVIGRSSANEVALPNDLLVSRTHAVIEQYAAGWVVRDLGAANGTFVNGVQVVAGARAAFRRRDQNGRQPRCLSGRLADDRRSTLYKSSSANTSRSCSPTSWDRQSSRWRRRPKS